MLLFVQTSSPINILIAGCGYVGIRAAHRFIESGDRVAAMRRTPPDDESSIHWISGDLNFPVTGKIPFEIDTLVLAAGLRSDTDRNYERLFVEGYGRLIEEIRQDHPLKRIVMISTTSVFAESDGGLVDESSPVDPAKAPARYYLAAERLAAESGVTSCVLRLSGIYGPGRTRLIREVREGRARRYPPPPRYLNHIHADDAAAAVVHAARLENPAPLYVASDRDPADRSDALQWISDRLGLGTVPEADADEAQPPRSGNKRCCSDRLVASGFAFQFPTFREGYGEFLAQ